VRIGIEQIKTKEAQISDHIFQAERQLKANAIDLGSRIQSIVLAGNAGLRSDISAASSASTAANERIVTKLKGIDTGLSLMEEFATTQSTAIFEQLQTQQAQYESNRAAQETNWAKAMEKMDRLQSLSNRGPSIEALILLKQIQSRLDVLSHQRIVSTWSPVVEEGKAHVRITEVAKRVSDFALHIACGIRQLLVVLW
jgi:hypothetical protein